MSHDECDEIWSSNSSVSQRVIEKVADELNMDPQQIGPLYQTIDPEALDRLFQSREQSPHGARVEFQMSECEVVVYGTGQIEVSTPGEVGADGEGSGVVSPGSDTKHSGTDD